MSRPELNKCYMCDAGRTMREHVPPIAFFPKNYRKNLITVPSCPDHNTRNSKDVEYVRNVIVSHIDTNDIARSHFQEKVMRSFKRSPKLFTQTFKDANPIIVDAQETGVYNCDLPRFNLVMKAIAHAVYFKNFGNTYTNQWEIFSPSLISPQALLQGQPDGYDQLRRLLRQVSLTELRMPQPEVFMCGFRQWDEARFVYKFMFYGGFVVYAVAMPPTYNAV